MDRARWSFEDLEVWQLGRSLRKRLTDLTKAFPGEEKYRLSDQLIRAARSVTANIAEGYGRFHYQENIQFCRMARGSVYEILDHLIVSADEEYFGQETCSELKAETYKVIKKLNGYIQYLQKSKNGTHE